MALNKFNQISGDHADIEAIEDMPVLDMPEDDTQYLGMVQDLEEKYEAYLKEKAGVQLEGGEDFEEYARQRIKDDMEHETVNIYAEEGISLPYLWATWWKIDNPGFDLFKDSGKNLDAMFENLNISPTHLNENMNPSAPSWTVKEANRIFEARYELPQYDKKFKHKEAVFYDGNVIGWFDFMAGVPFGCLEKMGIFGEVYSEDKEIGVDGEGKSVPPVPDEFFSLVDGVTLLFNRIWLGYENVLPFEKGLSGHPIPTHDWWVRFNLVEDDDNQNKVPTPGEFMGIALWIFPNLPWGWQLKNPFVFSGNWIETVYYTSAKVLEVVDETTYIISYQGKEIEAKSTDYAIYKVEDRVTILKGVEHPEDSMTWKDMTDYNTDIWSIIPMVFYEEAV